MLALIELGEIEAVDAALAAAHAAVRTTKSRWTIGFLETVRALLAGRLADAEAAVARGHEAALETKAPAALVETAFVRLLSCIRLVQGRMTEYEPARDAMVRDLAGVPPTHFVVRAHAARERGDRDAAREAFERALSAQLLEQPRGPAWMICLTWAADICAWLGDRPRANDLLDLLAPFSDVMTWQYGPVGRVAGLLELALGRAGEAERLLRAAVALCERMGAEAFLAMARHDLGSLLLPSAEGRRLVDQARAAAAELGLSARMPSP
jgi:hypothetical protein